MVTETNRLLYLSVSVAMVIVAIIRVYFCFPD